MELLASRIGSPIDAYVSTTDDEAQPRGHRRDGDPSPLILWCAQISGGANILYLVDIHPRKLIIVGSFFNQSEVLGNVDIATKLVGLGILTDAARDARHALPREISDEFPPRGVQTSLFERQAS